MVITSKDMIDNLGIKDACRGQLEIRPLWRNGQDYSFKYVNISSKINKFTRIGFLKLFPSTGPTANSENATQSGKSI